MLTFDHDETQINRLERVLAEVGRDIDRDLVIAINKTAKKTKSGINKEIRKELAVKASVINKALFQTKRATKPSKFAIVQLKKTDRIPLRDFSAKQVRKGVSYRISKRGGRKLVPGAFQGPRPGRMKASWKGNVFRRVGKARLPIRKLFGVSPWGVFVKRKMDMPTVAETERELEKQVGRRADFWTKKLNGTI